MIIDRIIKFDFIIIFLSITYFNSISINIFIIDNF